MRRRFVFLLLLIALAAAGADASPVAARSSVLRSEPPDGAMLARAPQQVRLWFSSAVDLDITDIVLADADGSTVTGITMRAEIYQPVSVGLAGAFDPAYLYLCSLGSARFPTQAVIELPTLTNGVYELSYRALSADDRRITRGAIVFTVGVADDVAPAASVSQHADDLFVTFAVRPNHTGRGFVTINVANTRRPAPAEIAGVSVQLRAPGATVDGPTIPAQSLGEGRYRLSGVTFDTAGQWQIRVIVARVGVPDAVAATLWDLPTANKRIESDNFGWLDASLVALILLGSAIVRKLLRGLP